MIKKIANNKPILVREKCFNLKLFSELFNDLCDGIEIVNATFTTQLIFAMLSLMLTDIFGAYGVLRELIAKVKLQFLLYFFIGNSVWITIQYAIKVFLVHAGSSTTNEAEKSIATLAKAAGSLNSNDILKSDLMTLIAQLKCRNMKLKNVFFEINWNLILTVS